MKGRVFLFVSGTDVSWGGQGGQLDIWRFVLCDRSKEGEEEN
jgi:hypothetical protein